METETLPRDSETLTEQYVEEDLQRFISTEKMKLLEMEAHSVLVCSENPLHEGVKKEGELLSCAECGAKINVVKKVK